MSTPCGGHAVHLTSSGREQQNGGGPGGGGGGKLQQLSKHQPQLVSNGSVHQQMAGNVQTHLHSHTELDPRVLSGGHHGPPPPKVEAMGMMDAWTRMAPQYASQATHSPLEAQFINSSPAAYYHAPVSPYGAAYAGLGSESTHGAAPWSNGTDVASYFGYPGPTSAEFHHPESMSIPGLFGNGYPAGTYGAPGNFGQFAPFTPTHTAPGPAVSQDYTGWGATTPHDLLDQGAHQKNPYGDYYGYDLISATPNIIGPAAAPLEMAGAPITMNCDERVKSLGNQMENLSMGQSIVFSHESDQTEHHVVQTRPVEICAVAPFVTVESESSSRLDGVGDELKAAQRHPHDESSAVNDIQSNQKAASNDGEATSNVLAAAATTVATTATITGAATSTGAPNSHRITENNDNNNNNNNDGMTTLSASEDYRSHSPAIQATPHWNSEPGDTGSDAGGDTQRAGSEQDDDTGIQESAASQLDVSENEEEDDTEAGNLTTQQLQQQQQADTINLPAWNWIDAEVKDWSASPPPPPPALPPPQVNKNVSNQTSDPVVDEQTSTHLLQDLIRKNNYNPKEFDGSVEGARFFVIKSYSEDDVHRSIKYSIWCSTEHGNKKLDQAFCHQKNNGEKPIYLFYSVNGSGHFCGMAQMTSSVDYETLTGVWAQDKWKGKFNVKWIYVKDIPNPELRHIRLENNENKPVTNSRDTQEIPPEKGRQVLEIMHKYRHETSLFDDFVYYEDMEHKRETERENHQGSVLVSHSKDRSSPPSGVRTAFRNPPKRKDHSDDVREGHSSNGNHRDNHHGKDYHQRDLRDRNAAIGGGNVRSFGGASAGSYNHNHARDGNSRGFGFRGEDRSSVGRSFTNFRRNVDRDRDYSRDRSERMSFSNRYNTSRNDTAHWKS